jgi:uncharacterized protein YcbK (DUF882 family)
MKNIYVVFSVLFLFCFCVLFAQSTGSLTGNISGLDSDLLDGLQLFAELSGKNVRVTTGVRSQARQDELWNQRLANGGHVNNDPVCALTGGRGDGLTVHDANCKNFVARYSKHADGNAADISVDGANPTRSDCSNLNRAGLGHTVSSEMWHIEYTGGRCLRH